MTTQRPSERAKTTITFTAAATLLGLAALLAPRVASACSGYTVDVELGADPSGKPNACAIHVFVPESGAVPYFEVDTLAVKVGTRTIGYSRSEHKTSARINENCNPLTINYTAHVLSLFEALAPNTVVTLVGRSGKQEVKVGEIKLGAVIDCSAKPKPTPWACFPCNSSNNPGPSPTPTPPKPGEPAPKPGDPAGPQRGCACSTAGASATDALPLVALMLLVVVARCRRRRC